MSEKTDAEYIYIVQAELEKSKCKIGITNDLERRLKEYNSMTGKSQDNPYSYLFAAKVADMRAVENSIKSSFSHLREESNKEIYFYNKTLFSTYVAFIKSHKDFIEEIIIKPAEQEPVVKLVKKTTPSLAERELTRKEIMDKAKKVGNDEFYTRLEDIEKELAMYDPSIWLDKTVFCNCDDAVGDSEVRTSAFATYFIKNFMTLGLKKLICTHYSGVVDLFNAGSKAYIFTKAGYSENKEFPPNYDGSFEHPLSVKILHKEADMVVTNPPFSKTIDYWKLIIGSGKQFIIISSISNAVNTAYIPYFKNKLVWAGYNRVDYFLTPKRELCDAAGHWYTNIPIVDRPKHKLLKIVPLNDIPEQYKKYDDAKTLLLDEGYIPSDYAKPFAISARPILNGVLERGYSIIDEKRYTPYINNKEKFARVLLQKTQSLP